jgi:FkbM family methyltransferase
MDGLKKILLTLLGEKGYLSFLAASFQRLYKTGGLGRDYQDIYFLKEIIEDGDFCADIGAHLGYYTIEMSRLVKDQGKIFAIEPMTKFQVTLQNLIKKYKIKNVEVFQVALGGEGSWVEMGIPEVDNMKKFGYARVKQISSQYQYVEVERIKNESGDHLFELLPRLDFVKCDVEGLEVSVFASMMKTIAKHLPVLLCELADKQERIKLYEMLLPFGYRVFRLENKKLWLLDVYSELKAISHNHYFIPEKHEKRLMARIETYKDKTESSLE